MHNDIERILYTASDIMKMTKRMGKEITADFQDSKKKLLILCILKGAAVFFADLVREIKLPVELDFMRASSYGSGVVSGAVSICLDLNKRDLSDCNVIIVEDILDTGKTLHHTLNAIRSKGCEDVRLCVLLNKAERRVHDVSVDYEGAKIPDAFVVGYGLDYDEKYRNLPYIGILKKEIYSHGD